MYIESPLINKSESKRGEPPVGLPIGSDFDGIPSLIRDHEPATGSSHPSHVQTMFHHAQPESHNAHASHDEHPQHDTHALAIDHHESHTSLHHFEEPQDNIPAPILDKPPETHQDEETFVPPNLPV